MNSLISIGEAKERIRQSRLARRTEWISLLSIRDQILAEDVVAPFDSPQFDNSAMDGIAVRWVDVKEIRSGGNLPLTLIGESSAGHPYGKDLLPGQAVRISTGAVVPTGADCVIPQEDCVFDGDQVVIQAVKQIGQHIRNKGEEYRKGHHLLHSGTPISPAITGVLGSIGMDPVKVYKTPVITLLVTGSELARPGTDKNLHEGKIYDSNRPMIAHYLKLAGIENIRTVWVKDQTTDIRRTIRHAQARSDIIISTGGISVGPHDHIPVVAEKLGFSTVFTQVAQKPGKPFYFARKDDTLYFGLPGNPVSAFMLFTYYIYPEIRWYRGWQDTLARQEAILESSLTNNRDRTLLISARIFQENAQWKTEPLAGQASHKILPLAEANGFIIVPPYANYNKGDAVGFYFLPIREVW